MLSFTDHFIINYIGHSLNIYTPFSSLARSVTIIYFTELFILFSIIVYHLSFSKLVSLNLSRKGGKGSSRISFLGGMYTKPATKHFIIPLFLSTLSIASYYFLTSWYILFASFNLSISSLCFSLLIVSSLLFSICRILELGD